MGTGSDREAPARTANDQSITEGGGKPIPAADRAFMERRFGHDFGKVRVHADDGAARSAAAIGARAYTAGPHIAFAAGRYASSAEGRWLLAHELAHVVQQSGQGDPALSITATRPRIQRKEDPRQPGGGAAAAAPLALNYEQLAEAIHKAIAGLGTDEEAVYAALHELRRDQASIDRLGSVYFGKYNVTLEADIRDDFSGSELEYALQLMNMGHSGSKQEIKSAPSGPGDIDQAARRIRDAVEGWGTDEVAIYAVLEPFNRDPVLTNQLQEAYFKLYKEDLRDRLISEMSGDELEHALNLLETPYQHYIQEANERLAGGRLKAPIGFGFSWTGKGWYDSRYWDVVRIPESPGFKLVQNRGKPHEVIDELYNEQSLWHVDCAQFVQVAELYAKRHTMGPDEFDKHVGGHLELKVRGSTGVTTKALYQREAPGAAMTAGGQVDPRPVDQILEDAPIGSRVRWSNQVLIDHDPTLEEYQVYPNNTFPWFGFQHENSVKLGPDKFSGHGLDRGPFLRFLFGAKAAYTRAEMEQEIVDFTVGQGKNMLPPQEFDESKVRQGVFISEIEYFDTGSAP